MLKIKVIPIKMITDLYNKVNLNDMDIRRREKIYPVDEVIELENRTTIVYSDIVKPIKPYMKYGNMYMIKSDFINDDWIAILHRKDGMWWSKRLVDLIKEVIEYSKYIERDVSSKELEKLKNTNKDEYDKYKLMKDIHKSNIVIDLITYKIRKRKKRS